MSEARDMATIVEQDEIGKTSVPEQKKKEKRSLNLIADFVDGYASGWCFAVSEAFKEALDIRWTERKVPLRDKGGNYVFEPNSEKKVKESKYFWTQGTWFNFEVGHIFYDTRLAYDLSWGEALKHIQLGIQITEVYPPDTLKFTVCRPSPNCTKFEPTESFECTQQDFVELLITGVLKMINNNTTCLLEPVDNIAERKAYKTFAELTKSNDNGIQKKTR